MKDPKPSEGLKELHAKLNKPNQDNDSVLEEQLAGMIRYRVEQEHQKYAHRDYVEKYESKDFWIEAIARKLSNTLVQDVIKAHYYSRQEVEAALPDPSEYDHKHDAEIIVRDLRHTLGLGGSDG